MQDLLLSAAQQMAPGSCTAGLVIWGCVLLWGAAVQQLGQLLFSMAGMLGCIALPCQVCDWFLLPMLAVVFPWAGRWAESTPQPAVDCMLVGFFCCALAHALRVAGLAQHPICQDRTVLLLSSLGITSTS